MLIPEWIIPAFRMTTTCPRVLICRREDYNLAIEARKHYTDAVLRTKLSSSLFRVLIILIGELLLPSKCVDWPESLR